MFVGRQPVFVRQTPSRHHPKPVLPPRPQPNRADPDGERGIPVRVRRPERLRRYAVYLERPVMVERRMKTRYARWRIQALPYKIEAV